MKLLPKICASSLILGQLSAQAYDTSISAPKFNHRINKREQNTRRDEGSSSLINRLEKRMETQDPVTTTRPQIMARSLMLSRLIQLLDIDGYGCWCNFSNPGHKMGSGEPVDVFDQLCQTLHLGYECAMIDSSNDEDEATCIPWEVNYKFASTRNDLTEECTLRNEGDQCAVNACIIELTFVTNIMMKYKMKEMPNAMFKHRNGLFDASMACHSSNHGMEASEYNRYFYMYEDGDDDSEHSFDREENLWQGVELEYEVKKQGVQGLAFDKDEDQETDVQVTNSDQKSDEEPVDSLLSFVQSLPAAWQQPFISDQKYGPRSSMKLTLQDNRSCCGSYPNRKPFKPANFHEGTVHMCCGSKTYNPGKLECCRGSILMKHCPEDIPVTYNIF